MTNTPPDDKQSSQTNALGFDDFIGILVAFATIGAILFWSFSRKDSGWNLNQLPLGQSPTSSGVQPNQPTKPNNLLLPLPSPIVQPNLTSPPPGVVQPTPGELSSQVVPPAPALVPFPYVVPNAATPQVETPVVPSGVVTPSKKKSTIPPPIAFTDVPANFWAERFINALSSRGIIKGFPDYSFRPNQAVNRAEYAAILQEAFDKELSKTSISFADVPSKFWATPAIDQAISTGFLKGYPDKTFKPEQKIPRVQVLVALVSGMNLKDPASPEKILSIYKDAKDIPKYAIGKIAAATANNLVVNYPDTTVFNPNKEATRAEVAAMVHQALVRMGRLQTIQNPNIVIAPR